MADINYCELNEFDLDDLPEGRKERWERLTSDPDLIDNICASVASGASLVTLSETWQLPYGLVANWIRADEVRDKQYNTACCDRHEWMNLKLENELEDIALADMRKLFKDDGTLKPMSEWPDDASKAVAGIDIQEYNNKGLIKKIKVESKLKAIELALKKRGLLTQKHEVTGSVSLEDLIGGSYDG